MRTPRSAMSAVLRVTSVVMDFRELDKMAI
jgi:hypothetical protein